VRIVILFSSLVFFGCVSQLTSNQASKNSLDSVIQEGSDYIVNKIQAKTKVGVVNMNSSSINLSNYVIDSIIMYLVNSGNFVVIERSELDIIQKEQKYQISGEVSDETAVSIGKQLGTEMIITGSILPLGNNYSMSLKVTDIKTAQIISTRVYAVKPDNVLLSLLKSPSEEPRNDAPQTVIMGDVNIINNNETTIQGDVYVNMPKGFK
jgi:TolB-like protein